MRTKRLPLLLVVLLSLAPCGCMDNAPPAAKPDPVVEVATVRVSPEAAERVITAVGTLEPVARVLVAAQEEGVVTAVHVHEGDHVKTGQVLVELDDREIQAELAQAEASLEEAEARWQRVQSLRGEGVIAEQEYDAARAAARINTARVEALHTRLSFTRIQAAVDGLVITRQVEVGNLASPRSPLLELATGDGLLLRVPVSELEVVHLKTGDRAAISVDALPEERLRGTIARIFPAADSASRQVTVELRVDDAPASVRFGFLARAHLVLERLPNALLVPEAALQRGADVASFLWISDQGTARMREVTVGLRSRGRAVISSGLSPGDEVVVQGMARLRDGVAVKVAQNNVGGA